MTSGKKGFLQLIGTLYYVVAMFYLVIGLYKKEDILSTVAKSLDLFISGVLFCAVADLISANLEKNDNNKDNKELD